MSNIEHILVGGWKTRGFVFVLSTLCNSLQQDIYFHFMHENTRGTCLQNILHHCVECRLEILNFSNSSASC